MRPNPKSIELCKEMNESLKRGGQTKNNNNNNDNVKGKEINPTLNHAQVKLHFKNY